MRRVQRRRVGPSDEGGWTLQETCMGLLCFFLLFLVLSPHNEVKGDSLDNFNITRINFHFVNVFIYEK
jgi:hypothetical protein